jgi:hypothetical protein
LVRETRTDQPENIGKVDDRSFSANEEMLSEMSERILEKFFEN